MFKTKDAWMNFFYSFGAAIVILGAWLKITHITLGPINGNMALTVGLITEAIIFIISLSTLQNLKSLMLGKMFILNY
jgi:gliding motility-associated protein GldL